RTYQQSYLYMTMVEVVGFLGMSLGGLLMSLKTMGKNGVKTLLAGMTAFGLLAIGMGVYSVSCR
ncbi:MAG: MFS transporter, partial [Sphaerochaeta sp.]|nr:MFS transporter [Sphaerochaeta sp.]